MWEGTAGVQAYPRTRGPASEKKVVDNVRVVTRMLSMTKRTPPNPDKSMILQLAAEAGCHPATAKRALTEGVSGIKGDFLKERINKALVVLGLA